MDYFICTNPRVGSNLLCSLLIHSKLAGVPTEYFDAGLMERHLDRLGMPAGEDGMPHSMQAYYDACREQLSSPSGKFGIKVHAGQLRWALTRGFDLERNMPTRFVYVNRADIVGQALSYARALQTGAWMSVHAEKREPVFDPVMIKNAMAELRQGAEGWERIFAAYGIEPHRVSYEQLMADMPTELGRIFNYLDIDASGVDVEALIKRGTDYHQKQSDGRTAEWRRLWDEEVRRSAAAREANAVRPATLAA